MALNLAKIIPKILLHGVLKLQYFLIDNRVPLFKYVKWLKNKIINFFRSFIS